MKQKAFSLQSQYVDTTDHFFFTNLEETNVFDFQIKFTIAIHIEYLHIFSKLFKAKVFMPAFGMICKYFS